MIQKRKKKCADKTCQALTYNRLCTLHDKKRKIEKAKKKKSKKPSSKLLPKEHIVKYPKLVTSKKHAWDAMSLFVRLRDSNAQGIGKCITCATECYFHNDCAQAGHFRGRKHLATFLHEQNVHLQCARCNGWGNGMSYEYGNALNSMYGAGTAEMLAAMENDAVSYKSDYYIERIMYFTESAQKLLNSKKINKGFKEKIQDRLNFYIRFASKYIK